MFTSVNSQTSVDVNRKIGLTRVNFCLPFALKVTVSAQMTVNTNMKITSVMQCNFLYFQQHHTWITQAASWNLLLIYLLWGNCSCTTRRGRMQIDFGLPPFLLITLPCKLSLPLNTLRRLSKRCDCFRWCNNCGHKGFERHSLCRGCHKMRMYRCRDVARAVQL